MFFFSNTSLYAQVHQHDTDTNSNGTSQQQNAEENTVEIEPEKQQLIGVKTTEAVSYPMQKVIRTIGRIEYDERRISTVNAKFEGWIEKLHVDFTGKYVKKGSPLAEIYSPELVATQQELLNVLKWNQPSTPIPPSQIQTMLSKDSERIAEAAKTRLRLWDITEEQIKTIEETGKPLRTLTIYSPINGYVVQKEAVQGMRIMPGEKLFDIADLSTLWVVSDIYEYDLSSIKAGQTANITLSYLPDKAFQSTIDYVYPALSGDTRTAKVRFTVANPSAQLKPQMFTNVEIKMDLGKRLAVPDDAVIDTGARQIIYVDKGEGYFEAREVHTGIKSGGMTEILHGLDAGEKVAVSGTFLIDSEAQLKGVKPIKRD